MCSSFVASCLLHPGPHTTRRLQACHGRTTTVSNYTKQVQRPPGGTRHANFQPISRGSRGGIPSSPFFFLALMAVTKLCFRVPFYGHIYTCYSFCGDTSLQHVSSLLTTVRHRLSSQHNCPNNRTIAAHCFNNKAPSLYAPRTVEKLLSRTTRLFSYSNTRRAALRTGPSSLATRCLNKLLRTNVSHLSVNMRSFSSSYLGLVGHHRATTRTTRTIHTTRHTKFNGVAISLVFNVPNFNNSALHHSLSTTLSLNMRRVSTCRLAIRPSATFKQHTTQNRFQTMSRRVDRARFLAIRRALARTKFRRCRISGFTLPNFHTHRGTTC